MQKLLISAAALALLALPAMAQSNPNGFDLTHGAPAAQPAAPQAAPQQRRGGERSGGGDRGGDRGGNRGAAAAPAAAPAAQPQAQQDRHVGGAYGQDRRGDRGDNNRNDANRNGFDQRGGDNRNGFDQRGRNDNNRGNWNGGNRGNRGNYGNHGSRNDFSNFRNYHRSFNASRRFRGPSYRRPTGWYDHRWTFGEFLPSLFWSSNYWLNDYDSYDLPPPPYGAVWVRNGRDALLIDRDSGEVISVEYGVFY